MKPEQVEQVAEIVLAERHSYGRWEHPLDEPAWIQKLLDTLGRPEARHCDQCADAPSRLARDRGQPATHANPGETR